LSQRLLLLLLRQLRPCYRCHLHFVLQQLLSLQLMLPQPLHPPQSALALLLSWSSSPLADAVSYGRLSVSRG
jgi:hypothetical protein